MQSGKDRFEVIFTDVDVMNKFICIFIFVWLR